MNSKVFIVSLLVVLYFSTSSAVNSNKTAVTSVDLEEVSSASGTISYKVLNAPHNLFIGRCKPDDNETEIIHQENIIATNDGKSCFIASIKVQVTDPVYITCVKIFDEIPDGNGGYPTYIAGGVGYDFVEFKVDNEYGKGFHFFVQIYGYKIEKEINVR